MTLTAVWSCLIWVALDAELVPRPPGCHSHLPPAKPKSGPSRQRDLHSDEEVRVWQALRLAAMARQVPSRKLTALRLCSSGNYICFSAKANHKEPRKQIVFQSKTSMLVDQDSKIWLAVLACVCVCDHAGFGKTCLGLPPMKLDLIWSFCCPAKLALRTGSRRPDSVIESAAQLSRLQLPRGLSLPGPRTETCRQLSWSVSSVQLSQAPPHPQ